VNHASAARLHGGGSHTAGALNVQRLEALAAAFIQDCDKVDDGVGLAHCRRNTSIILNVNVNGLDLVGHRPRQVILGDLGVTRSDPDDIADAGQAPNNAPADEPGATENRNALTRLLV
jgi:hypothetical protein